MFSITLIWISARKATPPSRKHVTLKRKKKKVTDGKQNNRKIKQ